jgi:antitoxin component YwqK of YwqJK toxin-antitoxin module
VIKNVDISGQILELNQFKNGKWDGLSIFYDEDGTQNSRKTYKDGEVVFDSPRLIPHHQPLTLLPIDGRQLF